MNNIQNYGMANYQIGFQARGNKAVKTMADKMQQDKLTIIENFSKKYGCSIAETKKAFNVDSKTTVNQLKGKITKFKKILEELKKDAAMMKCNCNNAQSNHEGIIGIIV